ncbi:hypothetical protein HDV06_005383 [Boothiomyces sp. JEL0866]|nr:hypothetical protein HDV06_005383 [Boothiomyces sp. JEL0866]
MSNYQSQNNSSSILLEICDYRTNYLGCSLDRAQYFATIDLAVICISCVSIIAFSGLIIRNLVSRKNSGKKWTSIDNLCVLCCLSNIFRIAELANVRSVVFKDQSLMDEHQIKQYFQTTIFVEFFYYGCGALASNVSVASSSAGVNMFADIKVGSTVLSPEKILKIIRLVVLLATLGIAIGWATLGINNDLGTFITYRRANYILPMCTIVFVSMPVIIYFGNNVIKILNEGKASSNKNISLDSTTQHEGSKAADMSFKSVQLSHNSKRPKSVLKPVLSKQEKISNFKMAINMSLQKYASIENTEQYKNDDVDITRPSLAFF